MLIESFKVGLHTGDVFLEDVEGDDVMGLLCRKEDVIVSDDKDMLTIPGLKLKGGELIQTSEWAANFAFYSQVLIGDTADNYPGCKGVGKVKAAQVLSNFLFARLADVRIKQRPFFVQNLKSISTLP